GFGVRQESCGQLYADSDGHKKIGEQKRQQDTRNFHYAARAAPAYTLRIIKYGTAFLHVTFQPGGTAGKDTSGLGLSPSARFRLLYCKMRSIDEASFLESPCGVSCRSVPAALFRAEVPRQLRRH